MTPREDSWNPVGEDETASDGLGGDDVLIGASGNDDADGGLGTDECEAEIQNDCEVDLPPGPALGPSIWELMPLERIW
ncbi:MAG: hypothetical protein ACRDJB_10705 [Actinomycetota bacterium]